MTRIIEVNGKTFEFVNESFSNSRNWGHKSRLYINNGLVAENKSIYYNRTWENYQYQSCMKGCVYNLIDEAKKEFITNYKKENYINRLSKAKKDILDDFFKQEQKDLFELLKLL